MSDRTPNLIGNEPGPSLAEREVVEIPLLLPGWQVEVLAAAAQDRGLTAGEMVRRVLREFIQHLESQ